MSEEKTLKHTGVGGWSKGHPITWLEKEQRWVYCDTGAPLEHYGGEPRPCKVCGADSTSNEGNSPDVCLGRLPGVAAACCGHGNRDAAYVVFKDGTVLRKFEVSSPLNPTPRKNGNMYKDNITIKVFQEDWIPGFAAYRNYEDQEENAPAHVVLNVGSLMAMVEENDCEPSEVPYVVAECLMHEVIHALEDWAKVEFSEDRVEELLEKYREKYGRPNV